jgi:hypothetical protein
MSKIILEEKNVVGGILRTIVDTDDEKFKALIKDEATDEAKESKLISVGYTSEQIIKIKEANGFE